MTERNLRVGLIGFGLAGRVIHLPLLATTPGLELAAVYSRGDVGVELPAVTVHTSPDELIADPSIDLVVVATPNATHGHWTRAALNAGKHVLVEKPFALSLDEAREIIALATTSAGKLFVFQNRRFDSDYLTIKQVIDSGAIGDVTLFESSIERYTPVLPPSWDAPASEGSGVWYDIAPHLIDQAIQLFGAPESVLASFAVFRDGDGAEDWANAILSYPGKRVDLTMNMRAPAFHTRFRVHGKGATAIKRAADRQGSQYMSGLSPNDAEWGVDPDPVIVSTRDGPERVIAAERGEHRRFYLQVVEAIRGIRSNPTPPSDILNVMAVLDAGVRSAAEGRAVPIEINL